MYGLSAVGSGLLLGAVGSLTFVGEPVATGNPIVDYVGPILSTGLVGIILTMILLRIKIMPTYVYDEAKAEWQRERADLQADIADLKQTVKDGTAVYTTQVIPVLTRVFEAEKELVDIRRSEQYSQAGKSHA